MRKTKDKAKSSPVCVRCDGKCCRYFCFEIDKPDSFSEFDDIRWYLLHEGVSVHVEDGDWYISIANPCKALGKANECGIYADRPIICRNYRTDDCEITSDDYGHEAEFHTPEELQKYARRVLGKKAYEKGKAKAIKKAQKKEQKWRRKMETRRHS